MKFQQFSALQKNIQDSSSLEQPTRSFLVIHTQREERRKLLENLSEEIKAHHEGATILFLDSEQVEWKEVHESLMTPSLFGEDQVIIWNGLKGLSDPILEKIKEYVLSPSSNAFFIMGAENAKGFSDLYQKTKKELVLLDYTAEKPWNKQKRVQQELVRFVQKEGKSINPDAFDRLTLLCGPDPLILESELIKIMTYVGEKKQITIKEVDAVCASSSVATGWQLSEGLVWGKTLSVPESSIDLTFLLSYLGQVRFYLQQGRQVGWCLQQRMDFEKTTKYLPQLKPPQFQKIKTGLRSRKMAYFDQALESLYEIELLSKNSNMTPAFLFDLLQTKLTHLKQVYAR